MRACALPRTSEIRLDLLPKAILRLCEKRMALMGLILVAFRSPPPRCAASESVPQLPTHTLANREALRLHSTHLLYCYFFSALLDAETLWIPETVIPRTGICAASRRARRLARRFRRARSPRMPFGAGGQYPSACVRPLRPHF